MLSPDTALVRSGWDRNQVSVAIPEDRWFDETWRRDFKGLSQLTSHLTQVVLGAAVFLAFVAAYNWIHHAAENGQEWVATTSINIHSEPDVSRTTRIGICEQGTRLRVINTRTIDKRIWYEVEVIGKAPTLSKADSRMWLAAEYVTLLHK